MLLYFSRFSRNDVIAVLWTVLIVAAVWRYRADGRTRWLVLAAAALALGFATKETTYIATASVLLYLNATLTAALLDQSGVRGLRRAAFAMSLFLVAWAVAALWTPLGRVRERAGWHERPREADLLVVLGTLTLPFLVAASQIVLGDAGEASFLGVRHGVTIVVVATMGAAAVVGVAWDARRWPLLALVVLAVTVPLYTTWFTNPDGFLGAFWGQLDYWLDQQDVRRGNQPWFYYLMMLPLYEFLVLIPALLGGAWLLRRGDRLARLLAWWFVSTLVAFSFAGEKMPWLNVHLAVPLALLAGHAIGAALPPLWRRLRDEEATALSWAAAGAGGAAVVLLVALSVRAAFGVSFGHPDTPVEPLIYTQTAPDVPRLTREIEDYVAVRPGPVTIVVDTTASLTWPWAWYLRDLPDVRYVGAESVQAGEYPEDAIVISSSTTLPHDAPLRARFASSRPYVHRWWFPEGGYRATSLGQPDRWVGVRRTPRRLGRLRRERHPRGHDRRAARRGAVPSVAPIDAPRAARAGRRGACARRWSQAGRRPSRGLDGSRAWANAAPRSGSRSACCSSRSCSGASTSPSSATPLRTPGPRGSSSPSASTSSRCGCAAPAGGSRCAAPPRLSTNDATALVVIGYAANNVLPMRAGELVRVQLLHDRHGADRVTHPRHHRARTDPRRAGARAVPRGHHRARRRQRRAARARRGHGALASSCSRSA